VSYIRLRYSVRVQFKKEAPEIEDLEALHQRIEELEARLGSLGGARAVVDKEVV
jgi:BMFP domain-containing protein YqiC